MYCVKCGNALHEGGVHCSVCGAKRQGRVKTFFVGVHGDPKRRITAILLSYAAGLLILAAAALVFGGGGLFRNSNKQAGAILQGTPTATVTPTFNIVPATTGHGDTAPPVQTPKPAPAKLSIGEEAAKKAMEGYTDVTPVVFADSQVEAWIRAKYIQKAGAITVADMKGITAFEYGAINDTAASQPLTTIFDLRYCVSLQTLDVTNQPIFSIESLRELLNLRDINLTRCAVIDLSPLAGKDTLQNVYISCNPISDASAVFALPNLREINVGGTSVTDISALRSTKNLSEFHCVNKLSDYTPLLGHTGMRGITLSGISNSDFVAMLGAMKNLTAFRIESSSIEESSLDLLAGRNFYGLSLEYCGIKDISALSKLTGVSDLRLGGNQIEDISALAGLTMIDYCLDIRNNRILDYSPLKGMRNLKSLWVAGNPVTDDETLQEMEKNGCKVNR